MNPLNTLPLTKYQLFASQWCAYHQNIFHTTVESLLKGHYVIKGHLYLYVPFASVCLDTVGLINIATKTLVPAPVLKFSMELLFCLWFLELFFHSLLTQRGSGKTINSSGNQRGRKVIPWKISELELELEFWLQYL